MLQRLLAEKRARENAPRDTTAGIWDDLFRVRIPMLGSRSIEDIRMRGTVISGNKDVDADIKNRLIVTYLNIDKMVELYKQNVPVRVCDVNDTKVIYNNISDHINAWKRQLEVGINIGSAPVEDLLVMDQFANTVFEHAKYQFNGEAVDNLVAEHFRNLQKVNVQNFFNPNVLRKVKLDNAPNVSTDAHGNTVINDIDETLPTRDSYEDFFKERMLNLRFKGN